MLEESESLNGSSSASGGSHSSEDCLSSVTDIDEKYYSAPNHDTSVNSVPELEIAIEQVKALVLDTEAVSEERHKLVKRLIELRLKLQDLKEVEEELEPTSEELRIVQSHQFILQKSYLHRNAQYCDRCCGVIWTVIQNYFRCKGCHYQCHSKCLNQVVRLCQFPRVSIETQYIRNICPEKGLAFQNYKCVECRSHFTLKNGWMEPRRCDYDGLYYCPMCHNNATSVTPARILRNWDFEERRVCGASKQFLKLMSRKPNINLENINATLFNFVEDLNAVKRIREEIIIMKEYFMTCREAVNQKLLRLLEDRQHFVENSFMYSLQDLIDVENGNLIKFLNAIHRHFSKHIRKQCPTCQGKGFICEICENIEVIFPFDPSTHHCKQCKSTFHFICFTKRGETCPKCIRKGNRDRDLQNVTE